MEPDGTDHGADDGQYLEGARIKVTTHQFNRCDGRRCAAAHAVIDSDHLRHVGHGDLLAGVPGQSAADGDSQYHPAEVVQARGREGDQGGDQHARARPDYAIAGCYRRTHALQAEDK